jgi:hypothetical protein
MRREQVVELLREALLPLPYVNAAWLGGSDAFGRPTSCPTSTPVDVDDGRVAATFGAIEAALAAASPIVARLVMPMPIWHGHAQRFYRLRDTAETPRSTWSCSSGPTRAATTTRPTARPPRWSCSTGPGSSARSRSTRPSCRHPGRGCGRHPGRLAFTCRWSP